MKRTLGSLVETILSDFDGMPCPIEKATRNIHFTFPKTQAFWEGKVNIPEHKRCIARFETSRAAIIQDSRAKKGSPMILF
ncbi:MAG: hypothetical protein GY738_05905 [Pseudoalteromonas sp.]|nr:hypothetical protein [Pseudoalteromonas sp.]